MPDTISYLTNLLTNKSFNGHKDSTRTHPNTNPHSTISLVGKYDKFYQKIELNMNTTQLEKNPKGDAK